MNLAESYVLVYGLAYIWTALMVRNPILRLPFSARLSPLAGRASMLLIGIPILLNVLWLHSSVVYAALGVLESFGFMACWWCKIVWNVPDAPNSILQSSMAWGDAVCAVALFSLM